MAYLSQVPFEGAEGSLVALKTAKGMELVIKSAFPLGSFHRKNGTTFSGIPFIPENVQWNEPKSRIQFTSQPEFPEFFGKWKTLCMSRSFFLLPPAVEKKDA